MIWIFLISIVDLFCKFCRHSSLLLLLLLLHLIEILDLYLLMLGLRLEAGTTREVHLGAHKMVHRIQWAVVVLLEQVKWMPVAWIRLAVAGLLLFLICRWAGSHDFYSLSLF